MKRVKIFPRDLDERLDYTDQEAIEAHRNSLQQTEEEQNILDGGVSVYRYSDEDAVLLISDASEGEPFQRKIYIKK